MHLNSFTHAIIVLSVCIGCRAIDVKAQSTQEPSIADAARQNREQKKSAPKTGAVVTNDTLNPSPVSTVSKGAPATPTSAAAPDSSAQSTSLPEPGATRSAAQPGLSKEESDKLKAEIAIIRQELKDKQNEVDLLQRLLNLDRDALLSKPDPTHDVEGKAKIDAEQEDLDQKAADFEKLKAKLQSIAPELVTNSTPPKS